MSEYKYEKIFDDGWKVTIEGGWTVIYNDAGDEVSRALTIYFFNNPYGYNCPSEDDMAEIIHRFWTE